MLLWKLTVFQMKKIILTFVVLALLISCSKKEQYYGNWRGIHGFNFMNIQQDSIAISSYGDHWNTYPITIKNNSLTFLDHTFKTSISEDSLIFENIPYVKNTITSPILEIELPKLTKYSFQEPNPEEELIYIQYGRVPNSNEYKLQLNDKYADFEEIMDYFFSGSNDLSGHNTVRFLLVCDKDAKMKDIEQIFLEMIKINVRIFYTVNHIEHKVIDNEIKQTYLSQKQRITPIHNVRYETKTDSSYVTGFDFLNNLVFRHINHENAQYLFLINNEFYVGKGKYSLEDFTKKIDIMISKNVQLISLFDLNSDFKHYTIFNALINDSYQKIYDSVAKQKYNATYTKLGDVKKEEIINLFPKKNIQNISIPHFLSFEETPTESVNFPFKNVKEQIPEVYFEQLR